MQHPEGYEQEGQVTLPLLLVMCVLVFFGYVYFQVGSAADQKVLAQTAGDSGAVAAAHVVRDQRVLLSARTIPFSFAGMFAGVPTPVTDPGSAACAAALSNWNPASHRGHALSCGNLATTPTGDGAQVNLLGPAGTVAHGPVNADAQQVHAYAHARVVARSCPAGAVLGRPAAKAAADYILDSTMTSFGTLGTVCTTPVELALLRKLDLVPGAAAAAIGDPLSVLRSVRDTTVVEIID